MTQCMQELLFVKKVVELVGLKIKLPMILKTDNKGAKDFVNTCSVGGRMRHIKVMHFYVRYLKANGFLEVENGGVEQSVLNFRKG
jgi:hypothetical protein